MTGTATCTDELQAKHVRERLAALKASVPSENRPVSLVANFYELLGAAGSWAARAVRR